MKIAALQLRYSRKDPKKTLKSTLRMLSECSGESVELVCLPELWLPEDFALSHDVNGELQDAAERHLLYVCSGALSERQEDGLEVVSSLISPDGKILGRQAKVHLFGSQRDRYHAATSLKPFKTQLGVVGMMVCYDNVFPEAARRLVLDGADILLLPSRIVREGVEPWHLYLKVRALENRIPIVAPNIIDPPVFNGHSLLVDLEYDSKRDIVYPRTIAGSSSEQILTCEVDLFLSRKLREKRLAERRPELY